MVNGSSRPGSGLSGKVSKEDQATSDAPKYARIECLIAEKKFILIL